METQGNPHLTLDLSGCPAEKLGDVALIFNVLEELPVQLGMNQIATPSVFRYTGKDEGEWGVTGVVLVEDSHISIHTFPERGRTFIDIFSCRDFDADLAKERLVAAFAARDYELNSVTVEERVRPRVFH
jgi:S-adenosylmethionine decarboxylase